MSDESRRSSSMIEIIYRTEISRLKVAVRPGSKDHGPDLSPKVGVRPGFLDHGPDLSPQENWGQSGIPGPWSGLKSAKNGVSPGSQD